METELKTTVIKQIDYLPEGLLNAAPQDLHQLLPEPTLIHLSGSHKEPLFISVQLHGNEPTGLLALQQLLTKYQNQPLPRSISLFLGNTEAASKNMRRLDGQPDFNRIWPGKELPESTETRMAQEIVNIMQQRNVFASIDVHNNTGLNPHYACINKLDNSFLQLASLFGRLIVYFLYPKGVQSAAFAEICPAVTLECGRPGQQYGVEHAFEFLNSCLHLNELSSNPVHNQDIDLFHTVAQVKIKPDYNFSFQQPDADLLLSQDIERMNFTEISAGTRFGTINNSHLPLMAQDEQGNDVTKEFFAVDNKELHVTRSTMPSMLTLDEKVIRQDCLCYLMERVSL